MAHFNIQKVLIAPLDWGLGHATRCIPLIRAFDAAGYTVLIATSGKQATLLAQEFPTIKQIELPGYDVRYSRTKAGLLFRMMAQIPKLLRIVQWEHRWLEEQVDQHGIDLVISDNRYGLYTRKTPSVIITHQLQVKTPHAWTERLIQKVLYRYIDRFTMCWVPDMEKNEGLAGTLSHPGRMPSVPVAYMGLLSRFEEVMPQKERPFITVLLSGPEPQRTMLEKKIEEGLRKDPNEHIRLVRGLPGNEVPATLPGAFNHLPTGELLALLQQSKLVICRGGYTSLMELLRLGIPAILVPTPGQTEQEYLAARLARLGYAIHIPQDNFELHAALENAEITSRRFPDLQYFSQEGLLQLMNSLQEVLSRNRN